MVAGGKASGGGAAVASNNARIKATDNKREDKAKATDNKRLSRQSFDRQMTYGRLISAEEDLAFRQSYPLGRLSLKLRQVEVRNAYLHPNSQWFIAVLIIGNFASNVWEKQVD